MSDESMRRIAPTDLDGALHQRPRFWAADVQVVDAPAPADVCPDCGGHGWISRGPLIGAAGPGASAPIEPCHCRATEIARERAARNDAERAARLDVLAGQLGKLARCDWANFDLERRIPGPVTWSDERGGPDLGTYTVGQQKSMLRSALARCRSYAAAPAGWLYIAGTYGSGKSHLAAAVARQVQGLTSVAYATAPRLLSHIKAGFGDGTADQRLTDLIEVGLLVVDDIGAEHLTDWAGTTLYELINARYLSERWTVLTSNIHRDRLPPRVATRVAEAAGSAGFVTMAIYDYRRLA